MVKPCTHPLWRTTRKRRGACSFGDFGAGPDHVTYDKRVGDLRVNGKPIPPGYAVRLTHIGKFKGEDPLASQVPERLTHIFALHPLKWEYTFHSLTLKDPHKIIYYKPTLVPMRPGTLIADMAFYNAFEYGDTGADKQYIASIRLIEEADLDQYKLPELLIPPEAY